MASGDLSELLETVAPRPTTALDIGRIERRAHRRRHRRRITSAVVCVSVVGSLVALATHVPNAGDQKTVVAGPASSRTIPVDFRAGTATTQVGLLDGTRLRLSLPEVVGKDLATMTFGNVELHGSVQADPGGPDRPPRGWRIDVAVGAIDELVPGGESIVPPSSPGATAATVDRPGRRLALQFGAWTVVASGETMTDADIQTLLRGVAVAGTPDGFVVYRGNLPLWTIDSPDLSFSGAQTAVSVLSGGCQQPDSFPQQTAGGLESYTRDIPGEPPGGTTELCDRANGLRIVLRTSRRLTDEETDRVRVRVLSLGPTLAALQRGEHP